MLSELTHSGKNHNLLWMRLKDNYGPLLKRTAKWTPGGPHCDSTSLPHGCYKLKASSGHQKTVGLRLHWCNTFFIQLFCFLTAKNKINTPPTTSVTRLQPLVCVELVNHAWQDLRSGVPLCLWGGSRAEVTCSPNRSLLTRGSNSGTCSNISLLSTGRTTHIHLYHLGLRAACLKGLDSRWIRL